MKAAVLHGYGEELVIEEIDVPRPRGEEVLIRVRGAGVCHSDLHLMDGEFGDELPATFPLVLGHEVSGVVEEAGEAASLHVSPGDEVLVYSFYCMGEDRYSVKGLHQICGLRTPAGVVMFNGGFAEYMLVPSYRYLVRVNGIGDLESAAILADAGLTAYRAVKKAAKYLDPDEPILIVGLGGTGLFGLAAARLLLPNPVVAVDINPRKVEQAAEIVEIREGIDHLIDGSSTDPRREVLTLLDGSSPKAVIDFVGLEKTIEDYLPLVAPEGVYVLVGLGSRYGPRIPSHHMIINEVTLTTVLYGSLPDLHELASLGLKGLIPYWRMTEKVGLEEINEAFRRLREGRAMKRQIVVP